MWLADTHKECNDSDHKPAMIIGWVHKSCREWPALLRACLLAWSLSVVPEMQKYKYSADVCVCVVTEGVFFIATVFIIMIIVWYYRVDVDLLNSFLV